MAFPEDRRKVSIRLAVLQYVVVVTFSVLAVSFWVLQVVQHAKYEEMAENHHQRTLALRAPRGLVFDRRGAVLVENRHSYSISIVREHTKDLNKTIRLLAGVVGVDEARVREIVDRHRREPTFRPITILQDATLAQVAAVTARRLDFELPDIVVEQVPTRQYPETMAAHLFGYVGEVNDAQVSEDDALKSGDIVGQSGIEKVYNAMLMGHDGAKRVVVSSVGREIRTLDEDEPTEGKRLQLTVDYVAHANFYGRDFKCWRLSRGGHGSLDLRHAIEQSCDVYFYTVANMVGVDKINKWATALGLGVKSGIDLPNEVQGLVPSTAWKREKMHEKWYAGETISVGIGQGQVSVTPVSMAVYMATLANGGTRVTPHLLKAVDEGSGWKPVPPPPPQSRIDVDPEKLQAIRDGLYLVVNGYGTGGRARIPGKDVSGKTGSAQVISNQGRAAARTNKDLRD